MMLKRRMWILGLTFCPWGMAVQAKDDLSKSFAPPTEVKSSELKGGVSGPTSSVMAPAGLRCELLENPLGIDSTKPGLSWKLDVDDASVRGVRQRAYQVMVASSEALLTEGKADLWDSGKVEDDRSMHIGYAGKPLRSQMECHWKVRVWTDSTASGADEPSVSPWSAAARWTMGLLEAADIRGKWIGSAGEGPVEPAPMFRTSFAVSGKVTRAVLFISGLGYHEASLNGGKIGDHMLDPKFTRYDRRVLYVTHDVTALLKPGRNALGVVLGNGWYNYHVKNPWNFHNAPWRTKPCLWAQLELEFADGTRRTVATDGSWRHATGPVRYDGMLNGETYDARLEKPGWDTPGYDDSGWAAARVVEGPKGRMSPQMLQPIRVTKVIKPVKVSQPKPGVYLFDMGQNLAGVARLKVKGPAGTEVKIQYGELLHGDGTLNQGNINSFCQSGEFQTDRYILKGDGVETWNARFMYHGFQYVQVTGFPGEPKIENLETLVMHTDVASAGAFECSNPLLNKIQECTLWSYRNNLHGHPTDCPNREKNGWTGDAHLAAEAGLYNFETAAMYSQWMLDFQDEQRPGGELPGIVPTAGWGYDWGNGPAWDSAYLLIPWYLYQYRGDLRVLEKHYDNMKRYVDYLTTRAENGIVSIGLGDWCPASTATPVNVTSTGYFYADALIVARTAKLLGKNDDATKYSALAESIRTSFNRAFLKPETKSYANGSQTALACAIYQGLADPADLDKVVENLVAEVGRKNGHLDTGILGAKYLLHALSDHGQADLAYHIATRTTFPSWGRWIEQGTTTLWENWNGEGTHNHVMFGDISAWFYRVPAGIQTDPAAPGFKKILIKPALTGDLEWVKCHHDSMHGRIISDWRLKDDVLTMAVGIPPNTTATVHVPTRDIHLVRESGVAPDQAPGVKFLRIEHGAAVYEVGSGKYLFTSTVEK